MITGIGCKSVVAKKKEVINHETLITPSRHYKCKIMTSTSGSLES